jgi:two-component system chemotaxis sensor kinase CheA
MDVVDRALTELDGDVDIDSEPGAGTTVRLTVPVSVAMANVWLVDSGGETFAVPADAVEQIEDPRGAERVDGREMFAGGSVGLADGGEVGDVGGVGDVGDAGAGGVGAGADADADAANEPVPLVRLREAFDTPGERSDGGMVLRLRDEVRPLAIHVDRVVDQQEVVVKPYGELLGSIPGVSGATLRGDGRLVNVVDVQSIDG